MKNWKKEKWAASATALCIAVFFYMVLSHLRQIISGIGSFMNFLSPVLWGVVIAFIMEPLVRLFSEHVFRRVPKKPRKYLSVAVSWILIVVLIILLLVALIPQLMSTVSTMVSNLDVYADSFQSLIQQLESFASTHNIDLSSLTSLTDDLIGTVTNYIRSNSTQILSASYDVGTGIMNGVIACIMAIYFLVGKERIRRFFSRFFHLLIRTEKRYRDTSAFWNQCIRILSDFIAGDLLDGLIIGVANFCFMLITGMPAAVLISVIVGVTNLAPTFGPIVGAVLGAFLLVWENPWNALVFLIFTIILQTIDGYVLKPRLFGTTLGVSSIWILICIIVGGRMFGVIGVLFAIPFAAISDYIYDNMILVRLKARKEKYAGDHPDVQVTTDPEGNEEVNTGENERNDSDGNEPTDPKEEKTLDTDGNGRLDLAGKVSADSDIPKVADTAEKAPEDQSQPEERA